MVETVRKVSYVLLAAMMVMLTITMVLKIARTMVLQIKVIIMMVTLAIVIYLLVKMDLSSLRSGLLLDIARNALPVPLVGIHQTILLNAWSVQQENIRLRGLVFAEIVQPVTFHLKMQENAVFALLVDIVQKDHQIAHNAHRRNILIRDHRVVLVAVQTDIIIKYFKS
jgi:hypothetical protein